MTSGAKIQDFSSVFDILLYHHLIFLFDLATKFSNLQLALSVFWQSYFPLPRLVSCLVKKKPLELRNNSEKKKKVLIPQ